MMGCWAAPYETEQAKRLRKLLEKPLRGKGAVDELYTLVGDDGLADDIDDLIRKGEGDDVRPVVLNFLQTWFGNNGDDEKIRKSWGWSKEFEDGALAIYKEMLTAWDIKKRIFNGECAIDDEHELDMHNPEDRKLALAEVAKKYKYNQVEEALEEAFQLGKWSIARQF